MPYIHEVARKSLESDPPMYPGELNYIITSVLDQYIQVTGLSYATLNEIIGVLECAKMELYRRIAAPYEDKKLSENGEVYHYTMKKLYPPKPATYGGGKFGSAKG